MFRRTALILSFTSNSLVRSFIAPSRHLYCAKLFSTSFSSPRPHPCLNNHPKHACISYMKEDASDTLTSDLRFRITHTLQAQPNHLGSILSTTILLLQFYNAPEPVSSACHIVAFTLQDNNEITDTPILWKDNLFAYLLEKLEPTMDSYFHSNNTNTHFDLDSFIRVSKSNIPPVTSTPILDRKLTSLQINHLTSMIIRRIQKEPLQYIFGKWDFYDFTLMVKRPCLCPRPETEELVYFVSQDIQRMIASSKRAVVQGTEKRRKIRILDVGAGTGAIGIALARMFPLDVQVVAIDIKEEAIQLSIENAELLLPQNFYHTMKDDPLYQAILCSAGDFTNTFNPLYDFHFNVIVSNPPYIPLADMSSLTDDVVKFEDIHALCGGVDGMDVIRTIIQRLEEWCRFTNQDTTLEIEKPICWMEVDPSQPSQIKQMLLQASSHHPSVRYVESRKDLSGQDRFVKLAIHQKRV